MPITKTIAYYDATSFVFLEVAKRSRTQYSNVYESGSEKWHRLTTSHLAACGKYKV
jgi:hypothetical protein